ncbi:unnamed protein product [Angiostrongylus costaricensis]|uniref:Tyr recombinase domain-containing protein n=1 Tax=Angiostrongylus costaricensis TaxID=334426 RepID=A0A0R3PAW7_ANGCS|nr:unnamed protein product [Angiostrongylus costaricensis]
MLAARGVSLGLGKINLSEFGHLRNDRLRVSQLRRTGQAEKPPKITIKKKTDAKIQSVPADVIRLEDIQKALMKWVLSTGIESALENHLFCSAARI